MRTQLFAFAFLAAVVPAQDEESVEDVALRLGDPSLEVRRAAVEKLLELRPDLAGLRNKLVSVTAEPAQDQWNTAIGLGGGVGGVFGGDLSRIAANLHSGDPVVRARAVRALCAMGQRAGNYQEDVLGLLGDEDADVRATVAKHVAGLGWNDEIRSGVLGALKDGSAVVRKAAAEALGADRNDAGIVAALRGAVQDPDLDVRATVVRSLGKCGEEGRAAASDIVAMLRDREEKVRVAALDAVRFLKLRDARAVEEVIRCLDDNDWKVLEAALRATTTMAGSAADATDRVLELTRHERDEIRIQALGTSWNAAPEQRRGAVILRTVEMLGDEHKKVAARAESLLRKLVENAKR